MKLKLIILLETVLLVLITGLYYFHTQKLNSLTANKSKTTPLATDLISPYVDDLANEVRTLSATDLESLKEGSGVAFGGMAKAAELNGYPGPRHILDMSDELKLTDLQQSKIQNLYDEMQTEAITMGDQIIEIEKELNNEFSKKTIDNSKLNSLVQKSADLYAQLREHHLKYHLQTVEILTQEQIDKYNELRGYGSDPCTNIPEGHDPKMWKLHNNCD